MKNILFLLLAVSLISCRSEHETEDSVQDTSEIKALQEDVKTEDRNLALQADSRKYAMDWVEFITAQNEIERIKNSTVGEVMNNSGAIAQIMQSLQTSLPDSLKSVPVEARLNVLNTKAQLLKQYSGKKKPDPEAISKTASEIYSEFNNLKLQMNEIFMKSLEDFEKELEEFEERERDSIIKDSLN